MSIIACLGNKDNSKCLIDKHTTIILTNSNSSYKYKESPLSLNLLPSFLLQTTIAVVVATLTTTLTIILTVTMSL